jgi:ABC-2 type transport system permease protein
VVQLPAVLTVGAVVLAFVGLVPRRAVPLGWSVVVVAGLAGPIFGPPLRLPQLVIDLSPFSLVPAVPAVAAGVSGIATLTAVCLTLAVLGVVAVRHRDLVLLA